MLAINDILVHEINKLDSTLIPRGISDHDTRTVERTISAVVDRLGELSATTQGLNKVITSANKMRNSQNYTLYLLKDSAANDGKGDVIGLLKVGFKHLYLGDQSGILHEVEPLCVLDFYVEKSRQRHGLGRKLFDYMLQDTGTPPRHLAVDGPSPAMVAFLAKNYGMHDLIRHANNFAVVPEFFQNIEQISKSSCATPASSGAGRYTAHRPESNIGKVIHGDPVHKISAFPAEEPLGPAAQARVEEWVAARSPSPVETEAGDGSPRGEAAAPPERPSSLPVTAAAAPEPVEPSPAGSRRDSQLTDKGFFDVKFYHNKLW